MSKEIDDYIKKQKTPQRDICKKLRKILLKTFPNAQEEIRWGVPVYRDGKFYIGALKDKVNLGFAVKGLKKEQRSLFEGAGKTMKHIKIRTLKDIDEKRIERLLKMVDKGSNCGRC